MRLGPLVSICRLPLHSKDSRCIVCMLSSLFGSLYKHDVNYSNIISIGYGPRILRPYKPTTAILLILVSTSMSTSMKLGDELTKVPKFDVAGTNWVIYKTRSRGLSMPEAYSITSMVPRGNQASHLSQRRRLPWFRGRCK